MKTITLIFALLGLTACGQVQRTNVRDYNFYIDSNDSALVGTVARLMATFNRMAGANILMLTSDASTRSHVSFSENLNGHNGYVGYGSWEEHRTAGPAATSFMPSSHETRTYSMNLTFDKAFFSARAQSRSPEDERDLLLAFCHEVGHGLMMNHEDAPESVMYSSMDGAKDRDYAAFFQATRSFLNAKFRE